MIIINDFVYSIEMWEWFHNMKDIKLDFEKKINTTVEVFEIVFFTEERYKWPRDYYKLDLCQLWEIVLDIFKWISGVQNTLKLDIKFKTSDISHELEKIYRTLLWWCFAEGLEQNHFGDFDYTMIDNRNMALNQHFRYRVYHMVHSMQKSFDGLANYLADTKYKEVCDMEEVNAYSFNNDQTHKDVQDFILNEIKKSTAGDADEFILYTISNIQNKTMKNDHEKLCQLVRFIKFEDTDFTRKLPPGQIWHTLFEDVFDGKDEVFYDFYEAFTSESIMYFLSDYVLNNFGIERIPIYNVFTQDKGKSYSKDILNLLDTVQISKRIRKVIKTYEMS